MGFKSVDGYQRAFQKEFNCNPYEYSKNPIPIYLFNPYGVKFINMEVKRKMVKVKNVFVQVVEKPAREVIIKNIILLDYILVQLLLIQYYAQLLYE